MRGSGWHSVLRIFKGRRGLTVHHAGALRAGSDAVTDIPVHHFPMGFPKCPNETKSFATRFFPLATKGELPKCPIETESFAQARKRAIERCKGRTLEEVEEEVRVSVLKAAHMLTQARLGVRLQKRIECRLWRGDKFETKHVKAKNKRLRMDKNGNVITLTGLKIFPKAGDQGGETIVGSLEVHANGFLYATSSPSFHFHFLYADVKQAFFRVEDDKMPPLLHFHLRCPIKVGEEVRQDIQFHLVQIPVGQRSSDKIENEKQIRDRNLNEDLKNFVHKVQEKWRYVPVHDCYPFSGAELHKSNEFQGNLLFKAPTVFGLTFSALVGLVNEPFVVVNLFEVEFVSLRLSPWGKPVQIDMTIVFQDFKRDLIHINSIPIDKLDVIKDRCYCSLVKYYETHAYFDWDSIVKELADSTENLRNFFHTGGWSIYEDFATKCYYDYYYKKEKEIEDHCELEEIDGYCGSDYEGEGSDTLEEREEQWIR